MQIMSQFQGYLLIALFGLLMLILTLMAGRNRQWTGTRSGFLYAGRQAPALLTAFSIAASWIWAPALFVSVQKSYELGLAGLFWFTAPNVIAVFIYAFIGPAIRRKIPGGFSIPDWIRYRFSDEGENMASLVHKLYLVPYLWYQVMAVTVQIFVGGMIIEFLTGISLNTAMILMLAVGLSYSLISGLRASLITDFLQMTFILLGLVLIVPWVVQVAGWQAVEKGLAGTGGSINIFDPGIAFSFGIVTSIGLLAGSIADQQFWQRCFAIREKDLARSFIIGGILFALVPLSLSVLGFIAASPGSGIVVPEGTGLPMIGIAAVVKLLPLWAAVVFVIMLLAGLSSTLDSGLAAGASLYAIDMHKGNPEEKRILYKERLGVALEGEDTAMIGRREAESVRRGRIGMLLLALAGLGVALIVQHIFPLDRLWWIFNGVASMFFVPTILSIFWPRLSARGVLAGLAASLIGMAFFVYGNYVQNDVITISSAIAIIGVSLSLCLLLPRKTSWGPHVAQ
jgi:urea-proton symporter